MEEPTEEPAEQAPAEEPSPAEPAAPTEAQPAAPAERGTQVTGEATLTDEQPADLRGGKWYFNVHTAMYPDGELRAQLPPEEDCPRGVRSRVLESRESGCRSFPLAPTRAAICGRRANACQQLTTSRGLSIRTLVP